VKARLSTCLHAGVTACAGPCLRDLVDFVSKFETASYCCPNLSLDQRVMSMAVSNPHTPPSGAGRSRKLRDGLILVALLGLFLAGVSALFAATGWEEVWTQIARLSWAQVALLLCLSLMNYLLRGVRWHLFSRRLGLPTRMGQSLRHFLGGFAMTVTPGRVGELVRMRWLRRETGWAVERTAPLVLIDRATDLAAMGLMLGLALSLTTIGMKAAVPVAILAIVAAYVATNPRHLVAVKLDQTMKPT